MPKLILASGSPRRHEILTNAGIAHEVRPVNADESIDPAVPAISVPEILSRRKAAAAVNEFGASPGETVILASDTVVICEDRIFGKPADRDEAIRMLTALSGVKHTVATGICVTDGERYKSDVVLTDVYMRELSPEEISAYVDKYSPLDKAGAYGIQEAAGMFVRRIDGDYTGVVGLPLCRTAEILCEFGVIVL